MFFGDNDLQQEEVAVQEQDAAAEARAGNNALKERLVRLTADFDNFKRRIELDKRGWYASAKSEVIEKLLPFLDELLLAIAAQKNLGDAGLGIASGLELIVQNYLKALASLGVSEVATQVFDPQLHEALGTVVVAGKKDGDIVEVLKRGFVLDDKVLRPAQVIVARDADV